MARSVSTGRKSRQRLQSEATPAERALLRALQNAEEPYSFQYVVRTAEAMSGFYVVDFLLKRRNTFVELDGRRHFTGTGKWRDRLRTEAILAARPQHRLVRVANADVLKDPAGIVERLMRPP